MFESRWKEKTVVTSRVFTRENGLPTNALSSVAVGRDSSLYVTSYTGFYRFNGYDFERLDLPELGYRGTSRFVNATALPDGMMLLYTESSETILYRDRRFFYPASPPEHPALHPVLHYLTTRHDSLHFFSNGHSIFTLTGRKPELNPWFSSPLDTIMTMHWLDDQRWLLQTRRFLHVMNGPRTVQSTPAEALPPLRFFNFQYRPLPGGRIVAYGIRGFILLDRSGNIIDRRSAGTPDYPEAITRLIPRPDSTLRYFISDREYRWDPETGTTTRIQLTADYRILPHDLPETWLGADLLVGLNKATLGGRDLLNVERPFGIKSAALDPFGQLWICTESQGLYRFSASPFRTLGRTAGLPGENMYGMLQLPDGRLAVNSLDAGPMVIGDDGVTWWNKLPQGKLGRSIHWIQDRLWAGHYSSGFWELDSRSNWRLVQRFDPLFASWNNVGEAIVGNGTGHLLAGTREMLVESAVNGSGYRELLAPGGRHVEMTHAIQAAGDGSFLILTGGNGVFLYRPGNPLVPFMPGAAALRSTRDRHVESDSLWFFASQESGLVALLHPDDSTKRVLKTWTTANGLPDNALHRMIPDSLGNLWISSNSGLIRARRASLRNWAAGLTPGPSLTLFTTAEGLPSDEFNGGAQQAGLYSTDGWILFPGQRGLVAFRPETLHHTEPTGPPLLKPVSFQQGDSLWYFGPGETRLSLPTAARSGTFRFDAKNLGATRPALFEFRTDSTAPWQIVPGGRAIPVTGLNGGIQTLFVRQVTTAGIAPVMRTELWVTPLFTETIVFKLLLSLAGAGMLALVFVGTRRAARARELHLEKLVDSRTRDLTEERNRTGEALQTVQKQAEQLAEADRYKTDLFLGFTHELRTPLTLIRGPLELLQQTRLTGINATASAQLDVVQRNAEDLTAMVNRLLYLIRLNDRSFKPGLRPVDLNALLARIIIPYKSRSVNTSLTLDIALEPVSFMVETDPESIELILSNLLSNAFKFGRSRVRLEASVPAGGLFRLVVWNDGDPIPEESKSRLFDLFFRDKAAEHLEGSGVGLTVVKRIVQALGGTVEAQSDAASGTTFTVLLPMSATQAVSPPEPAPEIVAPPQQTADLHGKPLILVVDDNPDFRTLLSDALSPWFAITHAANGNEALALFRRQSFDLIISDVMMPGMSGFEFAEALRTDAGQPVPFIFLSANDRPEALAKGLGLGADAFLTKPVSMDVLKAHIQSLLLQKRQTDKIGAEKADPLVSEIDRFILQHLSNTGLSIEHMARHLHMSRAALYRAWQKTGQPPIIERILQKRLSMVLELVTAHDQTFSQAALACGFSDLAYFSRAFKKTYGCTPTAWRSQAGRPR